jgi:hypothetical protein
MVDFASWFYLKMREPLVLSEHNTTSIRPDSLRWQQKFIKKIRVLEVIREQTVGGTGDLSGV